MGKDKLYIKDALEHMPGGFLIYRADYDKEEIIYANKKLINLFECDDYEDFLNYTNGSFKGIVCEDDYQSVESQIRIQINSGADNFDHIHYHIITKKGKVLFVEDYGQYVENSDEGPLFYVYIVDMENKALSYDIDHITGLPGDKRFIENANRLISKISKDGYNSDFAVVYINILRLKNYNLKKGFRSGNEFLKNFAATLNCIFKSDLLSRLSDNNFAVFAEIKGLYDKIQELDVILKQKYSNDNVKFKAGVYVVSEADIDHFDLAIDNARTACHDIVNDDCLYRVYDDEMRKEKELYEYVTTHIDSAIDNGYIKVYYQPAIRTLTNRICNFEALARWIDPKYGFLAPYKFIGPLEETRQIHKLDSYMIQEVCRYLRERIDNQESVVPVSFNLSRHDFMLTDAFKVVMDACKKYEIPHRLIKIEITETTVIEDPDIMKMIINKFRNNGFEIYMDDFGSGYSSLNFLKNFAFDEIKLDMQFLIDFSDKSKTVIKNSIVMAKELGIQTLAEGVETKEQYEFLKSIGCEKAQGYLFSKPLPYAEAIKVLKEKGYYEEENRFRNFFDGISKINFVTDQSVCLVHDDGANFEIIFHNEKFSTFIDELGVENIIALSSIVNAPKSIFKRTVRINSNYLPSVVGEEKVFFYTFLGNYIRFQLKNVGNVINHTLYWVKLDNLTTNKENTQKENLESNLREIYNIYDSVVFVDTFNDSYDALIIDPVIMNKIKKDSTLIEIIEIVKNIVYQDDINRFLKFIDFKTFKDRIANSKEGYITDCFRFIDPNNEIRWKSVKILSTSNIDEDKYLVLGRSFTDYENDYFNSVRRLVDLNEINKISEETEIGIDDILKSVVISSDRFFFWKDKERRFLGASNSFLDVYDIKNVSEIIGKTDADMGWNVTELEYRNDEWDVIKKGKIIRNAPGRCIIRGVPHNIACSKWPIYSKGKIVGLFGYFIDLDQEEILLRNQLGLVDNETGVLNSRGFVESLMSYIFEAKRLNSSFTLINVIINRIDEISNLLGKELALLVEREVANVLKNNFGMSSSVSHTGFGKFVILKSAMEKDKADLYCQTIEDKLLEIKEVGGTPITIYGKATAINSYDVNNSTEQLIQLANLK